MLNRIPKILPPELVKYMMEMGHGDTLVIADAHFPASTVGKRVVQCPGAQANDMLEAILQLMPLDSYIEAPVKLMQVVEGDPIGANPPIWRRLLDSLNNYGFYKEPEKLERFAFYKAAQNAYVVIQTGETAQYANIILHKGIVKF